MPIHTDLKEQIFKLDPCQREGTSSTTVPKSSIHQRKVLLCLWWDRKGPVYYELLKQGKTINADLYCNQLNKLNAAIKEKRPALASRKGIVFHHDNARPHTTMVTQQKLNALGWDVFGHPPYSPDIAPSDYYLFRSLENYLMGKISSLLKVFLRQLLTFNAKNESFYKTGIHRLPERWQQVVTNNGAYIID
ncbi:mariner Mos1 transposase [Trichonephila clavipes]|nr:mariner Mos1 transposase [Trichonephila clavipes]